MKCSNGRMIFEGVHESFSSKACFMEKALGVKQVQEDIAKRLMNGEGAIMESFKTAWVGAGAAALCMEAKDAELEKLFDGMYGNIVKREMRKMTDDTMKDFSRLATKNSREYHIEPGFFLLYAMCTNEACRERLVVEVTEREEYYALWEQSVFHTQKLERHVPAAFVWDMRLMAGILEKLRLEGKRGDAYKSFMRIMYAGFGHLKRLLKGKQYASGGLIKEAFAAEVQEKHNMLSTLTSMVLVFIMAEDMGLRVLFDFDLVMMMPFLEDCQNELSGGQRRGLFDEGDEAVKVQETHKQGEEKEHLEGKRYKEFLEDYDRKYKIHNSLADLAVIPDEEGWNALMYEAFLLFGVSTRKFGQFELTEKECMDLWRLSDKWKSKDYKGMVVIAQLAKYIAQLEQDYIGLAKEGHDFANWKLDKLQSRHEDKEMQYQAELNRLTAERKRLEELFLKKEQELGKLQSMLKEKDIALQEQTKELGALRSYVYAMSEEWEAEDCPQEQDDLWQSWNDRKVLVVGGHVNWQNKLRDYFPNWQFVLPGQRTFDADIIRGKDYIICNTEILDHSSYYKVVAGKSKCQRLLYVHSSNIQKCILELEGQMKLG